MLETKAKHDTKNIQKKKISSWFQNENQENNCGKHEFHIFQNSHLSWCPFSFQFQGSLHRHIKCISFKQDASTYSFSQLIPRQQQLYDRNSWTRLWQHYFQSVRQPRLGPNRAVQVHELGIFNIFCGFLNKVKFGCL